MGEASPRMALHEARHRYEQMQAPYAKKPKPLVENLERDLKPGWLLPYLFGLDSMIWGRWEYWAEVQGACSLPDLAIPRLDFTDYVGDANHGRKMIARCLNAIANENLSGDGWMGWSSFRYFDYFLDWLLFGFGHTGYEELPSEETPGALMRLYQLFDLSPLVLWPHDHLGDMLAECNHGRHNGFFPTPHNVVELMVQMVMIDEATGTDMRDKTVCDPCVGTGRMLLHASNHSLRLYGQDLDATMCKSTLVNGYLFAPWLVRPIWWLDNDTLRLGNSLSKNYPGKSMNGSGVGNIGQDEALPQMEEEEREAVIAQAQARSDGMCEVAPPHYQAQIFDTEFDVEGTAQTAPILKRRKRTTDPTQLDLFGDE